MTTTYTATLSGITVAQNPTAQFPRILDCVKWAESYDQPVDCCDIYSASGKRVAQYRRPKISSYPAQCGVWVNAKIC